MQLSGWGQYPVTESTVLHPLTNSQVASIIADGFSGIARGMGKSYGDSSLAPNVISLLSLKHILAFDEDSGIVTAQGGTTLADLLDVFVPKGWFLPVTPGTRFVSLAGAIASDVHGKNHHHDGSFSDHLIDFKLLTADGSVLSCSKSQNRELFLASCGGMGLTGIILEARLQLKAVNSSYISQTTIKAPNLEAILNAFEETESASYSVAWIDCLSKGKNLGRSLLTLGEHADDGRLDISHKTAKSVPVNMPTFTINPLTVKSFNALYYHKVRQARSEQTVHYEPYFYPLDGLNNWNRLYGKNGFVQYQFVIAKEAGIKAMQEIMQCIVRSGRGSPLAVLKVFGKGNDNYLSFPKEGYTLALDFKVDEGLFSFLNELDAIISHYDGRLYLTKDSRMSEDFFKQGYPQWQQLAEIRKQTSANKVFNSLQSQRLGL